MINKLFSAHVTLAAAAVVERRVCSYSFYDYTFTTGFNMGAISAPIPLFEVSATNNFHDEMLKNYRVYADGGIIHPTMTTVTRQMVELISKVVPEGHEYQPMTVTEALTAYAYFASNFFRSFPTGSVWSQATPYGNIEFEWNSKNEPVLEFSHLSSGQILFDLYLNNEEWENIFSKNVERIINNKIV